MGLVNMMSIHSNPGYLDKLLMLESINVGLVVFQGHWLSIESSLGSKVLDLGSFDAVGVLFFKEKMQKMNTFQKSK